MHECMQTYVHMRGCMHGYMVSWMKESEQVRTGSSWKVFLLSSALCDCWSLPKASEVPSPGCLYRSLCLLRGQGYWWMNSQQKPGGRASTAVTPPAQVQERPDRSWPLKVAFGPPCTYHQQGSPTPEPPFSLTSSTSMTLPLAHT